MRIQVLGPQRKRPQIGDRRVTKKHGLQIRVVETHNGMWVRSGSRYRYEWMRPEQLAGTQWDYLLNAEDRLLVERRRFARAHAADIEAVIFFGATSTTQPADGAAVER